MARMCVADDADAFAAAIVRLYRDATLWQRLADNGLRNVAEHFRWTQHGRRYASCLLRGEQAARDWRLDRLHHETPQDTQ